MKAGSSLENRDHERVEAYIAVRKQVDRTAIMQGLTMSAGDVIAIAARLKREGKIRIDVKTTGDATYVWTDGPVTVAPAGTAAGGVTTAPSGSRSGVTPEKPAEGVTKASAGPRRGVTPKSRGKQIRLARAAAIEKLAAPSNGAGRVLERIGKMSHAVAGLASSSALGQDDDVKTQLTTLASEAVKWRIELLEPEQRQLLESLFGLTGGAQ